MGNARFIYANLLTESMILSASSVKTGMVASALKDGYGSALISVSGAYTGYTDREYIIEIDSIAGGAEVGQATFKWSDGSGAWNATAVATSSSLITLNYGVKIAFTSGSGDDFELGDRFYFKAFNLFSPEKMLDWDRNTRYRSLSLGTPNWFSFDLGAATECTCLVLSGHNITSDVSYIRIQADDAATFNSGTGGTVQFSENVQRQAGDIVHYLAAPPTKRYWRVLISDTNNPDGRIEIGDVFLGTYLELSRNFSADYSRELELIQSVQETPAGVKRRRYYNTRRRFGYQFEYLTAGDVALLEAMMEAVGNQDDGILHPLYFNEDSDAPSKTWMVSIGSLSIQSQQGRVDLYRCQIEMEEVVTGG